VFALIGAGETQGAKETGSGDASVSPIHLEDAAAVTASPSAAARICTGFVPTARAEIYNEAAGTSTSIPVWALSPINPRRSWRRGGRFEPHSSDKRSCALSLNPTSSAIPLASNETRF
jgi:hypothetical protein